MNTRFSLFPILALFALALLFAGCEGNTNHQWRIENNGNQSISITANRVWEGDVFSTTIGPATSATISIVDTRGGSSAAQPPTFAFNSLLVTDNNGDTLTRNALDLASWVTEIERTSRAPSSYRHSHMLVVRESDF